MSAPRTAPKTALVIRHDPFEFPGCVGHRLAERGFELDELAVTPSLRDTNPVVDFGSADDHDIIVSLGSVWSVYDRDRIGHWIADELDLLAKAHASDVPVLGICFGGQALAAALGGDVIRSPEPEIGWRTVWSDRPEDLAEGPWMQWHYDRFTVPPGAVEVARNEAGSQAFVSGRCLGVQFHPEVTEDIIELWLDTSADQLMKHDADPDVVRADTRRYAEPASRRAARLVDWFVDEIAELG